MYHRLALLLATTLIVPPVAGQNAASAKPASQAAKVILLPPYEAATVKEGTLDAFRFQALARFDPSDPMAGEANLQTLSLFGREDLIAATSDDYRPTACLAARGDEQVIDTIVQRARETSVIIVNESHERSEHRGFTATLLGRLHAEGYTALAVEALSNPGPNTPKQYQPSFMRDPSLPYLEDEDGYYVGEAAFGRLGRTAKRLGYTFVPYEAQNDGSSANLSRSDGIAVREEAQSTALAAWIGAHPGAKLIVHVGYNHAREVPDTDDNRWMASRLKAKTGFDPLTISQTTCRGGSAVDRIATLPADEPTGTFDLVVDHPTARFIHGRPAWRVATGDVPVAIPESVRPLKGLARHRGTSRRGAARRSANGQGRGPPEGRRRPYATPRSLQSADTGPSGRF